MGQTLGEPGIGEMGVGETEQLNYTPLGIINISYDFMKTKSLHILRVN